MGTGSPDVLPRLPPRGVITKARGAAGDATAGILDETCPPKYFVFLAGVLMTVFVTIGDGPLRPEGGWGDAWERGRGPR